MQLHPPKADCVNNHRYCLHLAPGKPANTPPTVHDGWVSRHWKIGMTQPDYIRRTYILKDKEAVEVDWKTWITLGLRTHSNPRVAEDAISESRISTVFQGIDRAHPDGPPLIFETMVFGGPLNGEMDRCSTWDQAEAMHAAMCQRVRAQPTEGESC